MDYTFRLAGSDDASAIARLYGASRLPGAPETPGQFERLVQTGHAFLVAESGGRLNSPARTQISSARAILAMQKV